MKTGLDHLPPHKQRELERVVQIVFEEFDDVLALATQGWKRKGRIQKIILYGHCALLVCTFYSPHIHNLAFLRTLAEPIDPRLIDVWPREVKADRSRFEKLKEAYIKARYSKHFRITDDELSWLGTRVERLAMIVETICAERIAQLEATSRQAG